MNPLSFRLEKRTHSVPAMPGVPAREVTRWVLLFNNGLIGEPSPELIELWEHCQALLERPYPEGCTAGVAPKKEKARK